MSNDLRRLVEQWRAERQLLLDEGDVWTARLCRQHINELEAALAALPVQQDDDLERTKKEGR